MSGHWTVCYVGVGSNLGDARANVERAIRRLRQLAATRNAAASGLFASAPIDAGGDDYVNAVVRFETSLPAAELLGELQAIEHEFGRERPYRNAPRTLDLDLLLYGSSSISGDTLTVPHPRMAQRAFVLLPLLQLDPAVVIPGHGPAQALAAGVADQAIRPL
jgi:2-amino-4-hydroxy-6-hydroxymethyldihydropteridine diphosphokinase